MKAKNWLTLSVKKTKKKRAHKKWLKNTGNDKYMEWLSRYTEAHFNKLGLHDKIAEVAIKSLIGDNPIELTKFQHTKHDNEIKQDS